MSNSQHSHQRPVKPIAWQNIVGVALLIVALLSASTTVVAQSNASLVVANDSIASLGVVEVTTYAAEHSVTKGEAQRRLARIRDLQEVLETLRELESERLAGWGIDHESEFGAWIWLTGDEAPGAAAIALASAHDDVATRTGATHSYKELLAAQESFGEGPPQLEALITFTGLDMRANGMYVGVDPTLNAELSTPLPGINHLPAEEARMAAKALATTQLANHIDVRFEVVDGSGVSEDAAFDGGDRMTTCTAGFAANRNSSDWYGLITAGHCEGIQRVNGVDLLFVNGFASRRADAEFHRIPSGASHQLRDDYICATGHGATTCDVTGTTNRSSMLNDWVCHYGMNSGVSCGDVTDITFRPTDPESCKSSTGQLVTCHKKFVKVIGSQLQACDGDSGGPWFSSGIAYGIHKGGSTSDADDCSITIDYAYFSAIDEVQSFLSLTVLKDGNVIID